MKYGEAQQSTFQSDWHIAGIPENGCSVLKGTYVKNTVHVTFCHFLMTKND